MPPALCTFTVRLGEHSFNISAPSQGGSTLMQAIYLSGFFTPPPLCSGLGRCGRCRARYLAPPDLLPGILPKEQGILTPQELADGWRLSCLRLPEAGLALELPPWVQINNTMDTTLEDNSAAEQNRAASAASWGMAVDFGSTSLHFVRLEETAGSAGPCAPGSANALAEAPINAPVNTPAEAPVGADFQTVNPQMGAGSDIMSRLALAANPEGRKRLQQLSLGALQAYQRRQPGGKCREICLAANPGMTMILLDKDVSGLCAAPYRLDYAGGQYEQLPGLPPVWVAPLVSPFVGGDLSAGYASLALRPGSAAWPAPAPYPFLLADLGTNGEFILALNQEEALAASIPLGPALEGSGLACGTEAREGAITGFNLGPQGLLPLLFQAEGQTGKKTDGAQAPAHNTRPRGISGAAYLQLLHILRKHSLLKADGSFGQNPQNALGQRLARNFFTLPSGEAAFKISGPEAPEKAEHSRLCPCPACAARSEKPSEGQTLFLTAGDVEELLKIKAAFSLALQVLLAEAALPFSALKGIFLAGALGFHCPPETLEGLGFVPPGTGGRLCAVGNASLAGAALLLQRPELRPRLTRWSRRVKTLGLTEQPDFMRNFISHMNFPT